MDFAGLHSDQTFKKYLSLPIGNQPLWSILLTSTDLSVVYYSWEGSEQLEGNLEKAQVVHQMDSTSLF